KKKNSKSGYKITDEQFLEALKACAGIFVKTAKYIEDKYNITYSRQAVRSKAEKMKDELDQIRESNIDLAEATLFELMESFDDKTKLRAVEFYLKTQGKNRGYSDKVEMEHKGCVNIIWNSNSDNEESDEFD